MSLSPFDSFQSRFLTYLLNFPRTQFCGLHFGYQSDKEQLIKHFILPGGDRASLALALPALEEGKAQRFCQRASTDRTDLCCLTNSTLITCQLHTHKHKIVACFQSPHYITPSMFFRVMPVQTEGHLPTFWKNILPPSSGQLLRHYIPPKQFHNPIFTPKSNAIS